LHTVREVIELHPGHGSGPGAELLQISDGQPGDGRQALQFSDSLGRNAGAEGRGERCPPKSMLSGKLAGGEE
jgi:hypothetical protein